VYNSYHNLSPWQLTVELAASGARESPLLSPHHIIFRAPFLVNYFSPAIRNLCSLHSFYARSLPSKSNLSGISSMIDANQAL
jgi:hypothetical protein